MDDSSGDGYIESSPGPARSEYEGEAAAPPAAADGVAEPEPPSRSPVATKSPRRAALDAAFRSEADLRSGLTENLSQARTQSERVDERSGGPSGTSTPPAPRNGERPARPNHVEPGVDAFEATGRVMRERLDSLDTEPRGKGMAVRADSSLVEWEGRDHEPGRARTGNIDLGKLLDALAEGGVSSLSVPPAVTACEAERQAKALVAEIDDAANGDQDEAVGETSGTDDGDGDESMSTATATATAWQLGEGRRVRRPVRQRADGAGDRPRGTTGVRADSQQRRQQRGPGAPAHHVPAATRSHRCHLYHDFNTLQIAFDDVWTRVFDGELEGLGRELYREYVGPWTSWAMTPTKPPGRSARSTISPG